VHGSEGAFFSRWVDNGLTGGPTVTSPPVYDQPSVRRVEVNGTAYFSFDMWNSSNMTGEASSMCAMTDKAPSMCASSRNVNIPTPPHVDGLMLS